MTKKCTIGWREWLALPDLNIPHIKAKIDTGARTPALHAFSVDAAKRGNDWFARFKVHPYQGRKDIIKTCEAQIIDRRMITDSGGHREQRYVILTRVVMGEFEWPVEMTLTNRDVMKFRMLLGRTALKPRFLVDSGRSYLVGELPPGHAIPKRKKRI